MRVQVSTRPMTTDDLPAVLPYAATDVDRTCITWRLEMLGPNTVFLIEGQLAAAGGFQLHHAGVGEPWLVVAPQGRRYFRQLYRAIVRWLAEQIEQQGIHRLQAITRFDDVKAVCLLVHLGFTYEGTLRQFGPDLADWTCYGWVKAKESQCLRW